jgi:HlyD family secretion protein
MKRTILYAILGVVLIAAVVGALLWRSRVAGQPQEENRSAVVERGTMLVAVSASGTIEPQTRVSLDFEAPGRVAEVPVKVGDPVKAGDALARLDTARLELQVKQSQAALALAEAQLAQLGAGPRPEEVAAAEANVRAAEAQVSAVSANLDQLVVGAGDAQIAAAQADLAAAISQQKAAADTYDMVLTCFSFKLPTGEKQKICPALGAPEEQARFNLEATDKALAAAQARLDELLAGADADEVRASRSNVLAAAAQRDATQAQLDILVAGATDEQIADAEAQVTQAQAALNEAVLALERATLLAPFDGVVAGVNVTAGEIASSGLPPITVVDTSRFRVIASLDEIDIGLLNEGLAADVTVDALPDVVVAGTVERIAPVATPEGGVVYYEVTIGLAPVDAPLRADMTANVTIRVDELGDVLTIPTWVVRVDRTTGQTYVHRPAGDDFERVDVELGVRYGGRAQVLSGLSEGDEVFWVESTSFGFGGREG